MTPAAPPPYERSMTVLPASMTARLAMPSANPIFVSWRGFLESVKRPSATLRVALTMGSMAK